MAIFNNALAGAAGQAGGAAAGYEIERSLRFNSADSAYLSTTIGSALTTYTLSFWVKRSRLGTDNEYLFSSGDAGLAFQQTSDRLYIWNGSSTVYASGVYRDPSAWYHIVYSVNSNSANIYVNGVQVLTGGSAPTLSTTSGATSIGTYYGSGTRNYFFNGYLADVHFIDNQALAPTDFGEPDTNGVWQPIEYTGSYGTNGFKLNFSDNSSAAALGTDQSTNNNNWTVNNIAVSSVIYGRLATSGSDAPSSSIGSLTYANGSTHILNPSSTNGEGDFQNTRVIGFQNITGVTSLRVLRVSGPNAYLGFNGSLNFVGSFGSLSYPATINQAAWYTVSNPPSTLTSMAFSGGTSGPSNQHQIYRIEVNGVVLYDVTPSDFDSLFDSPTNGTQTDTGLGGEVSGNYCTMNPNDPTDRGTSFSTNVTLSNGNLDVFSSGSVDMNVVGTIGVKTGKYYWEATWNVAQLYGALGVISETYTKQRYRQDGNFVSGSATFTSGDIIGMALDLDSATKTIAFYKNGVSQGSLTLSGDARWFPLLEQNGGTGRDAGAYFNFGQRAFAYTAPSGFKALNTANLPDPTIADGSDYMDVVTYTATGGTSLAVGDPVLSATADSGVVSASQIFNGSTSDGGYYNGTGTDITLTTSPFTINTSLRVYQNFRSDGTYAVCLNSTCVNVPGTGTDSTAFRWSTVDLSTFTLPLSVTKLGYSLSQNSGNSIRAVEVDGTILINGAGQPVNFEPDLVWLKARVAGAHNIFDSVRGATKGLRSNDTAGEYTDSETLTSFDSNGFSLGTDSGGYQVNYSNNPMVGWAWDAGTSDTSITAGSLNSSAYDQSQTWSTGASTDGSNYNSTTSADAFDDTISTFWQTTDNATQTYTFSSLSSGLLEAYIYGVGSQYTITVDGANVVNPTANGGWVTLDSDASTVSTVTMVRPGSKVAVGGWRVNGKLLVDSGVTPTNVPSIASTVRANPSAGFSIVEFTNPSSGNWTFGHGLNAAPKFFVMRPKGATSNWQTYHKGLTALSSGRKFIWLNSTDAEKGITNTYWTSDPDSSVCYAGTGMQPGSQQVHIAYCWAPVEGYSAFGSYTGNGSADGPFVYTGFRPRWILRKLSSGANESWRLFDTERSPNNVAEERLLADTNVAEADQPNEIDILSNGFKLRSSDTAYNGSGSTYIYACFAENPFKYARAR